MTVAVHAATDVGLRRQQNEDSHGIWMPEDPSSLERRGLLMVVADGMGGSLAGEVASRIAVQTVLRVYRESDGDPFEDLERAVHEANAAVHGESAGRPDLTGMGTTCTAVVVRDRDLLFAHVGDSRAYVARNGRIRQITHDHSLVAQMVREGQLTADQAKSDPRRNVVTRSVGVGPEVEVDADRMETALEPGDTLLLCSDGLHGLVSDAELAGIAGGGDLGEACQEAIELANGRGGHDNITIVLARVEDDTHAEGRGSAARAAEPAEDVERTAEIVPGRDGGPADEAAAPGAPASASSGPAAVAAPAAAVAGRRRSTGTLVMWLILAFTVLLLAVVAMALIWQRIDRDRRALDAQRTEGAGSWPR